MMVTVVIPVYKSESILPEVIKRLEATLNNHLDSWELVLVDDGSGDSTQACITKLISQSSCHITAVFLMQNFGQHNAIMCGLRHARGELIITMDDDGQHPPEEIPKLLKAVEETGADVVYGVPKNRNHAPWRNLGSWIVVTFYKLVFKTRVTPSAFRIMRRQVVDAILSYDLNYTYIDGLLAWNTDRIAQIEVEHRPRKEGRSGYTFGKLFTLAMNLFTNFSLVPLQAVSVTGFMVAVGGFLLGFYYLLQRLLGGIAVPGWASIMVAVLVLGGLQMLSLGIIGEYLGRIHLNINKRPQYTIRERIVGHAEDRRMGLAKHDLGSVGSEISDV